MSHKDSEVSKNKNKCYWKNGADRLAPHQVQAFILYLHLIEILFHNYHFLFPC